MDPQLIQRLNVAAQDGSIEELYAVIGEDPDVLEEIDKKQFVQTPLHIAASAGRAHFAIEIMSLRPSFGRKLNPSGQSPLHLAVPLGLAGPLTQAQDETEKRQTETAIRLINIDNELIRVQGKERMTPLHYAAERNKFHLVAEFLCACPLSIEDLTIRCETALHVAARNDSLETVKLISGCHGQSWMPIFPLPWVRGLTDNGVLTWKNEDGDTALHIAASHDRPKVVKLIRPNSGKMNDKNLEGKTALDLGDGHQEVKAILVRAGASSGTSNSRSRTSRSLVDYMSRGRVARILPSNLSGEMGNVILVVAVLIATATFQVPLNACTSAGVFTPPNKNNNSNTITTPRLTLIDDLRLGLNNDSGMETQIIMVFNSVAFFTSIAVISFTLPTITDKNLISLGTTLLNVTNLLQLCLLVLASTYIVLVISLGHLLATSACYAMFVVFVVCVTFNVAVPAVELKKFSAMPVSRGNPSRFFEMRRQMVGL